MKKEAELSAAVEDEGTGRRRKEGAGMNEERMISNGTFDGVEEGQTWGER